ncbi:MAG: chromosomal replication initiator protein DnaA [Myxococcota bacterium]
MTPPVFWDGVLRRLGDEVPSFVLEAWVQPLVAETRGTGLCLLCPSALHRERVSKRYLSRMHELAAIETGHPVEIELVVAPPDRATAPSAARAAPRPTIDTPTSASPSPRAERRSASRKTPEQTPLPHTFDNFVVGPCNRLAREASFAVAEGRQQPVNPLYLASGPGLGKTHLARAIADARNSRGERVIYQSAETFTNHFTAAIRSRRMDQFKRRFRQGCDLLIVEDVQFLSKKAGTQLELFHTLNHLLDADARVVFTSDRLPREISALDERLGSRMAAGLVAALEPPDALVRREILRVKAASGGVRLPEDCLDLLVDVVRGSVRDLEGVLVQLVTTSSLLKRPIDLELTESSLRKISSLLAPVQHLEIDAIIDAVATFYRTVVPMLSTRSRRRDVVVPRQIAMYLCRRYTNRPASQIARAFGRNHPSVTNAERVVEKKILESAPFRYKVEAIASRLDELQRNAAR